MIQNRSIALPSTSTKKFISSTLYIWWDTKSSLAQLEAGIYDTYVRFEASEFTRPVEGLTNFNVFLAESNHRGLHILTITDLLSNKDITSFAEYPRIH